MGIMNKSPAPLGALKIKDAAKYLGGVSQVTIRRLIKRGLLKPNRALRHLLIPIADLNRFLELGHRLPAGFFQQEAGGRN